MKRLELETEIFTLLDGDLDADRVSRLESLLLEDPEARETYRSCAMLHSALATRMRGGERVESWNVVPINRIVARQRKSQLKLSIAAAVVFFLLVGSLLWLRISKNRLTDSYVFSVTPGSQFTVTHANGKSGGDSRKLLPGSRMKMSLGNAKCTLANGVEMLVEAPFDLTVISGGKLKLAEGAAWFQVPEKARGFSVSTAELEVVDLGTEFGIASSPDADDEVHVFTGKVSAKSLNPVKGSATLTAGQAASTDAAGRLHPLPTDRSRFLESLPDKLPDPAVYHIQSRWIGERFLIMDGDKLSSGTIKGDNGRWIIQKHRDAYLIRHPAREVYLRLQDGADSIIPVKDVPEDSRGHWMVRTTGDSIIISNKATGKYLSIEQFDKAPASNLDKKPSHTNWTSGLWGLSHVGGGAPDIFEPE